MIIFIECGPCEISGLSWNKLRWTVRCWKGAVRIWRRKIEGCRRRFRSLEHWNFPLSFTCKWPHQPHSLCALRVSVWLCHPPPLMLPRVIIPWPRPILGLCPSARGLPLLPFHTGRLMPSITDPSVWRVFWSLWIIIIINYYYGPSCTV